MMQQTTRLLILLPALLAATPAHAGGSKGELLTVTLEEGAGKDAHVARFKVPRRGNVRGLAVLHGESHVCGLTSEPGASDGLRLTIRCTQDGRGLGVAHLEVDAEVALPLRRAKTVAEVPGARDVPIRVRVQAG